MPQGDVATIVLILGALTALRFGVFAVMLLSALLLVGFVVQGVVAGEAAGIVALRAACGAVLFQAAYLAAAMLAGRRRHSGAQISAGPRMPPENDR
jgi:hypothetical protein